jgi:radical SAM protein with 4Fe4S-binding SPASM domain
MGLIGDRLLHIERNGGHLYFNPVSGGYVVTDDRGAGLIRQMVATDDEDEIIDAVAEDLSLDVISAAARYVSFTEKLKKGGLMEKAIAPQQALPMPYYGFIEVTRDCPSMCRICAIDTGRGSKDVLSLDEIRSVIDQFKQMGVGFVALTGGDPLMRGDLVDIFTYIRDKDMIAGFSTSLLSLDDATAQALARLGVKVQVSLDGSQAAVNDYNRGNGSYDRAMKGIDLLTKYAVEFRFAYCIMKHNAGDVADMIRLGRHLGAKEIAFRKIKLLGRALDLKAEVYPSPEQMAKAYTTLYRAAYQLGPQDLKINAKYNDVVFKGRGHLCDRLPCGAGTNIVHITYRGDIVPCSLFTEDKFIQGNVRQDRISDIWKTSSLLAFFRDTRVDDIPGCRECIFKYLCGGGCRAEAYFLHGDLMKQCCDCEDLVTFYDYLFGAVAASGERISL